MVSIITCIECLGFGATGIFTSLSAADLFNLVVELDQFLTNHSYVESSGTAAAATAVRNLKLGSRTRMDYNIIATKYYKHGELTCLKG